MYSTCIFCHQPLGANEVVEHFPVGRRLAFDAERGRLWVVCRKCERWNLTPLEERWEAIEECERLYRDTRLRASTDNVGLGRVREGLELVRIGRPLRPELAVWRYGDQFGRRRRNNVLKAGLGLGAIGALVASGVAAGVGAGGFAWYLVQLGRLAVRGSPRSVIAKLLSPDGTVLTVRRSTLEEVGLSVGLYPGTWSLSVPWSTRPTSERRVHWGLNNEPEKLLGGASVRLHGADAMHAARVLLPHINRYGGSARRVRGAVDLLESQGSPEALYLDTATSIYKESKIANMPEEVRLALEMAAHEETERRAMEGELQRLEQEWREAEEVAAISDNLFLPAGVEDLLRRKKGDR